jgi:PTH2 family peptidyl-tRNA hydrolase
MGKGKLAAQVSHAAVSSAEQSRRRHPDWWEAWLREGQCKVVVKATDLQTILDLQKEAATMKLPHSLITDRGLTQIPPNTTTCLGIGPAPSVQVDKLTGHLPLL